MYRKLLLAAVLFVSGCSTSGGSGGSDSPDPTVDPTEEAGDVDELIERAWEATVHAERFTVDLETRIEAEDVRLRVTADGWEDSARRTGDLVFESEQSDGPTSLQIVSDGETTWVRGDELGEFPDGIEWARSGDVILQGGTDQTDGVLQALYGLAGTTGWERTGDGESSDGTTVVVLETRATYRELADGAASVGREEQFRAAMNLTGDDEVLDLELELRVEVDEDDNIHRLEIHDAEDETLPIEASLTLQLGEFGVERDVPSPPDDDVTLTGPDADLIVRRAFGA